VAAIGFEPTVKSTKDNQYSIIVFKISNQAILRRCSMPKGIIRRLMDRGYGFIQTEQEEDLFFHSNSLEGVEFNNLSEGQEVEFEKGQGRDGRPAAVKVRLSEASRKGSGEGTSDSGGEGGADM
jgi:CspA family cold shock protein